MQVTIALTSGADYSTIKEIPQKDVCVGPQNHTGKTMSMNISTSKLLRHEVLHYAAPHFLLNNAIR